MKYLKYLLGIIAVLAIGFILIGVFKPTVSYGSEMQINKPAKEAWAVMMDESKMSQWLTGFKSAELISGTKNEVGAVSKITIHAEGEPELVMEETITAMKENEHMGMAFDMEMMSSKLDMYFEEKNGKTIFRSKAESQGKGIFWKSMFALMGSTMAEENLKTMENLKKVIEENTTDYFPAPAADAAILEEKTATNEQ